MNFDDGDIVVWSADQKIKILLYGVNVLDRQSDRSHIL